jgi:hypothetical protein
MTFTFTNYAGITPRPSPMHDIIGKMLGGYAQGVNARYMPQQQEADIFSKRIGPLATLATTPMFLQNPQFQAALGNMIAKNLGFAGKEFQGVGNTHMPTYAEEAQKTANKASEISKKLSKAGNVKIGESSLLGSAENYIPGISKYIQPLLNFFNKEEVTPQLAQDKNTFDTQMLRLKRIAVQSGQYSEKDADDIFTQKKDETKEQAINRARKSAPNLFEQEQSTDQEDQRNSDNKMLNEASEIAEEIQRETGKDIPVNLIYNYMTEHPGTIHLPSLLKAVGMK